MIFSSSRLSNWFTRIAPSRLLRALIDKIIRKDPPDLDEVWRNVQAKINRWLGRSTPSSQPNSPAPENPTPGEPLPVLTLLGAIFGFLVLLWLVTGFYIVREGQVGVVTQFGKYHSTQGPGLNWRIPFPFQGDEVVNASQIRTVEIGTDKIIVATGLRDAAILTSDKNIVEVKFSVQYRLSDPRLYLFETADPDTAVAQVAESAVREVIGQMSMDEVLSNRALIPPKVLQLMQSMLKRYQVGVDVAAINLSQDGVRAPEAVKVAFDDVLRADQEAERSRNEAQAYANDIVPKAKGTAAALVEEAKGYASSVLATAQGDAARFDALYPQYKQAPQAVRDRMYIDTMKQVYSNVTKVLVDARQGMIYLPLDKIMQPSGAASSLASPGAIAAAHGVELAAPALQSSPAFAPEQERGRDNARARERDSERTNIR